MPPMKILGGCQIVSMLTPHCRTFYTTILLRNSATLSHNAKFMAGRCSGIGTAIDLLQTIKKNNQTK